MISWHTLGDLMVSNLLTELAMLVVPVACAGCGLPDQRVCDPCLGWLAGPLRRVEPPRLDMLSREPLLPVWALGDYQGTSRNAILAWKNRGRADLDTLFGAALRMELADRPLGVPGFDVVVPMPSSAAHVRARGRHHLTRVAGEVAGGCGAAIWPVLRKRRTRGQVGLSARARGSAAVTVRPGALRHRHRRNTSPSRVLLFDDVVTTGATLAAAHSALTAAGHQVVGAVVLAATPPRQSPSM